MVSLPSLTILQRKKLKTIDKNKEVPQPVLPHAFVFKNKIDAVSILSFIISTTIFFADFLHYKSREIQTEMSNTNRS